MLLKLHAELLNFNADLLVAAVELRHLPAEAVAALKQRPAVLLTVPDLNVERVDILLRSHLLEVYPGYLLGNLLALRSRRVALAAEVDLLRIAASQLVLHAVDLDCEFRCLRLVLLVRLGLFNEGLFHLDYRGIQRILLLLSGNDTRAARPASSGE